MQKMYKEHFANLSKLQKTKKKKIRESLFTFLLSKINAELPSIWPKYFEILISISMTLTMRLYFWILWDPRS